MPSVWRGHLHFGLVVMPVRLLVAARPKTTRFRRLHRKPTSLQQTNALPWHEGIPGTDNADRNDAGGDFAEKISNDQVLNIRETQFEYTPVRQVLLSEVTGEEIRPDELVKGYEFAPNEYAPIDPKEIRAADVETSDTIDLFHFVPSADVDPIYFERSYYVAPDSGAEKVYALLLEAMRKKECFGIARIGMHRREHMLVLRPSQECLVAHTMFYANEIRPSPRVNLDNKFSDKEFAMALALIEGYSGSFKPEQFKDLYQERIHKIIDAQMNSFELPRLPVSQKSGMEVPDLMESIRLSLAQIESKKAESKTSKKQVQKTTSTAKNKPRKAS
jgi:DNA end-binding protein Ku